MTKKEQIEMDSMRRQVAHSRALCWPTMPEPMPVDMEVIRNKPFHQKLTTGWFMHTWNDEYRVTRGCSDGYQHSGYDDTRTTTQGPGKMYATKADALLAARWEICRRIAAVLVKLDAEAADAQGEPS